VQRGAVVSAARKRLPGRSKRASARRLLL